MNLFFVAIATEHLHHLKGANAMSKTKTTQQKHAKEAARKQAKLEERKKACQRAEKALSALPDSVIAEKIKPTASTVIFKGMTAELAEMIDREKDIMKLVFPLNDFYAEIKEPLGHTLKIHYVPFESPASRGDTFHYCRYLMGVKMSRNDTIVKIDVGDQIMSSARDITPDDLIATIYLEYEGNYSLCFVWHNPYSEVCCAQGVVSETVGQLCRSLQEMSKELVRKEKAGIEDPVLCDKFLAAHTRLEVINHQKNVVIDYVCAIQSVVETYLTGGTLPKLDVQPKKKPVNPKPKPSPAPHKEPKEPSAKDPAECIAYIHYETESGTLVINKSTKNYSMKWWIVSGHSRHYKSGRVTEIEPYIKGDKDSPEAQKALEVFKGGYQKIRTFQMRAKRK